MGIAERRAREREELRAKILDAASRLFVEEGFANVSLRKIADRIEYSPATIYLYFKDKEDLLTSLCWDTFTHLKNKLEEFEGTIDEPLTRLRAGLRSYIDFGLEHPNHYLLTFCTPHEFYQVTEETPGFEQTNRVGLETFDCLRRALSACRANGQIDFDDLETTAQVIWTFIHGTTSLMITSYGDPHFPWVEKERIIETSLDTLLRGLGARTRKPVLIGSKN